MSIQAVARPDGHKTDSPPAAGRDTGRSRARALILPVLLAAMGMAAPAHAGTKVASVFCSTDFNAQTDVKKKLEDLKMFEKVDNVDMSGSAPSLMTLSQYNALILWADTSRGCSDPTGIGNVIGQYIDAGGAVVQILPYYLNYSYSNIAGDFYNRYSLTNQYSMGNYRGATLGTKLEAHPILDGISSVSASGNQCYHRSSLSSSQLRNGGRIVANWSDGNGMIVVGSPGGHNRVDLNMYIPSSDIGTSGCLDPRGDAYKLIGNAIAWAANPVQAQPAAVEFGDVPALTTSLPMQADIVNTGTDPITFSGGTLSTMGEFTANLAGGATYPITLKKGEKFTVEFTVRPSAPGRRTATYTVTPSTAGAFPVAVPVGVNGIGPQFNVTPTVINYGGMPVGAMPRSQVVTITNTGGGSLTLRGAPTLADTTNFSIVSPPMTPVSLNSGASVNFEVKFNPTTEKVYSTTLTIPYNDGSDRNANITINGSYGKPKIGVPGSTILTPVRVNQKGPEQSMIITNTGLADLTISAVMFTGRDPGEFTVLNMPTMMTPIVVKPNGGTVDLRVQCNPTVTGMRQATLNITSDDPMTGVATVALQCNGVVANFDMTPAKIDYSPTQQIGQCTAAQDVVIKNSGTDSLRVLSVGFMGPNAASFTQPITGGRFVAANNGTLNIAVKFCPKDIGMQTADLVITTDLSAGHLAKVPLTGTGTGPKVVANPGTIDFGPVYIKATSTAKTILLTNEGDQPLVFGKSTLTPAPAMGPFKVVAFPAEGTMLNKGDPPIKLEITASPQMAQQYTGEIAIGVNDLVQSGTLRIPLSTVGTQADISVSPMMLAFPVTVVGLRSQKQTVTVTNTGKAPLTGLDIKVIGTNATEFVVDYSALPMAPVAAGANFQVPVEFRPQAANARTAILVVNAAGLMAPVQIKLDGTGKLLVITCSPDEKNFGTVAAGQNKTEKFSCRNSDSSDIDFSAAVSDFVDEWQISPNMGTIPAAQGGEDGLVSLQVTFAPTGPGERTTQLTLKTKDGLALGTISLDGKGGPMAKEKPMEQGCAYGATRRTTPFGAAALLLLSAGLMLLRRRRTAHSAC